MMITLQQRFFLFLITCLLVALTVQSHDNDDHHSHHNMTVCGTPDIGPDLAARINDIQRKKEAQLSVRAGPVDNITIATYACIVTDIDGSGDVNNTMIRNQIAILNQDFTYSGSLFRFELLQISRFIQPNAASLNLTSYVHELGLACRKGGRDSFNLFVVPNIESVDRNSVVAGRTFNFFQSGILHTDGVYVRNLNLANGGDAPYDLGVTAVHETGHWLGLIHPFQSLPPFDVDPCNPQNPNDYIDDTPQMLSSSIDIAGCPVKRDSCPNDPGLDPTDNYMDYGSQYDSNGQACKTTFTPEQVSRMADIWEYYRNQNDICTADEVQFELQIRFDDYPNETSWDLKFANGTAVHDSTEDQFGGYGLLYGPSSFAGMNMSIVVCIPRAEYVFTIYDGGRNGIAYPGYFRVTVDGQVKVYGTQSSFLYRTVEFGPYFNSTTNPSTMPSFSSSPSSSPSILMASTSPSSTPSIPTASTSPSSNPSIPMSSNMPSQSPSIPTSSTSPSQSPSIPTSSNVPSQSPSIPTSSTSPSSSPSTPTSSNVPSQSPSIPTYSNVPSQSPSIPTSSNMPSQSPSMPPSPAATSTPTVMNNSDPPAATTAPTVQGVNSTSTFAPTTTVGRSDSPSVAPTLVPSTSTPTVESSNGTLSPTIGSTDTTSAPTAQSINGTLSPTSSAAPTQSIATPLPTRVIRTSQPTTAPPTISPTLATPTTTSAQTVTLTGITMQLGGASTTLSGSAAASWNQVTVDQIVAQVYSTWSGVRNVVVTVTITKQVVQSRGRRELVAMERGLAPQRILAVTFKTKISVKAPAAVTVPRVTKLVGDAFNNGRSQQYIAALERTGEPLLKRVSGVAVAATASATTTSTSSVTTSTSRPVSSGSHGKKKKGASKATKPKTAGGATMTKGTKGRSFPASGGTTVASSPSSSPLQQQRGSNRPTTNTRRKRRKGIRGTRPF